MCARSLESRSSDPTSKKAKGLLPRPLPSALFPHQVDRFACRAGES